MADESKHSLPHVLLVSERFPPSVGGVQAAGWELASSLSRLGFLVSVATATPGSLEGNGFTIIRLPPDSFTHSVVDLAATICPTVILANGHTRFGLYPVSPAKVHVPVVFRSHGIGATFRLYWDRPPFFGIGSWCRRFARALRNSIQGAHFAQEVFLDDKCSLFQNCDATLASFFHQRNVSFIPNSFDTIFRPGENCFRIQYGIPEGKPFFLNVANYCDRKGQVDAVRIIRRNPDWDASFVFIGSEENETLAEAKHQAGNDPRLHLLAAIARSDVIEAINACDAAFLFAREEQQPLFLSEAMSCGKPWFSPNVGSVSTMRGGIVLQRRNVSCFARAVQELMSPLRRATLGAEGKAFWERNYSPDIVYARWKRLLNAVEAGKAGNHY